MKNLLKPFLLTILLFAFLAPAFNAQTTTDYLKKGNPGHIYMTSTAIDSAETIWTDAFTLEGFENGSFATYPLGYGVDAASADSISIAIYIYVCYEKGLDTDNWIVADTLATISSATAAKGTRDFNNVKAPFYKFKIVNNDGYPANTGFKFGIYAYKQD